MPAKKKTPNPATPKSDAPKTALQQLTEETRSKNAGTAESERIDSSEALKKLNELVVNGHNMEIAGEILRDIHERHVKLEAKLKTITKPMREAENAVRALFRPALTAWASAEELLKKKISEARQLQFAINTKTTQVAQKLLESGDGRGAAIVSQALAPTAPPEGVSVTERWKHTVIDPTLVPREYCSPDDRKLRAAVQLGAREIPGVVIERADIVTVRG